MVSESVDHENGTSTLRNNNVNNSNSYIMVCSFFAALNSVLLGYDFGVMSGAIIFIQEDLKLTDVQIEILVGSLSILSIVGNITGGKLSDAIGRKGAMAIGAIIFQMGVFIMTVASSFMVLMIGRLLSGVGVGLGAATMGVYISEISPAISRGFFTSFPEILINFGILLGYVSNYALSGLPINLNWRVMLAIGIIPSIIICIALFLLPESPRWLVMQKREDEAKLILCKIYENLGEAEERLVEIQQASSVNSNSKAVWYELLCPNSAVLKMLTVGIGIQFFSQISGVDALVYYSPTIFKAAGIEDNSHLLAATIAVGMAKTSFILVAIFLFDKVGRKPLLYISSMGMTVCLIGVAITLPYLEHGKIVAILAVVFVCGDVAFFSVGMGPICWVLTSEIYSLRLRAQAVALTNAANRLCSGLISLSFLTVTGAITVSGTFLVFSALSALCVVFVHKIVPETKGKNLEEIACLFMEIEEGSKQGHADRECTEPLMS